MFNTTPAYNLKVVLKETGIVADTLRAWERRYGLPLPQRTQGGHRLYSEHDIAIIHWLLKRQSEGLSISRAVDLWKEQIASGMDPLAAAQPETVLPPNLTGIEPLRREWLTACFNYDTVAADQILNQSFAIHSTELVCTEIILRGLYEVGELWQKGTASVQQEHFASGIATRRLDALINATPPPTRSETIVLACPPFEWHSLPLLLINLFLRRRGWNVIYLGATVPLERLDETLQATDTRLVVLSAQTLVNVVHLRRMARDLAGKGIAAAFGGRVFNSINGLQRCIPAHFLGNTIESAIPVIENLIRHPMPAAKEEPIRKASVQLAGDYQQNRLRIESALHGWIKSDGQPIEYLDTANLFLGDNLVATLELGNLQYLSTDLLWLNHLLIHHNISKAMLPAYLAAYAHAVEEVLGSRGSEIRDWLTLEATKYAVAA